MSQTDARAALLALERELPPNAVTLPSGFADAAERFVGLLLDANRRVNLTRVVEPEPVARLHLLDSLAALPILDGLRPRNALDLGSGGGVPGLILALARPETTWTLVDSVRKKADALRSFVAEMALPNVEVLAQRAEIVGRDPSRHESFDLVTARACAALPVLVEYALPLARVGGTLLAWKGRLAEAELHAGRDAARVLGGDEPAIIPTGFAELGDHRFVVVPKTRPTPARYPRRAGEAARRPLA